MAESWRESHESNQAWESYGAHAYPGPHAGSVTVYGAQASGYGRPRAGGVRGSRLKKVCTKCGRFVSFECRNCPEPHNIEEFPKDMVTHRTCSWKRCKRLNFFLNEQCYECGTVFLVEDDDLQGTVETDGWQEQAGEEGEICGEEQGASGGQGGLDAETIAEQESAWCIVDGAAMLLQAVIRGFLARTTLRRQEVAIVLLQALARGMVARRRQTKRRDAGNSLRRWVRGTLQAREYRRLLAAIVIIQAKSRGAAARRHLSNRIEATVRLQALARGMMARAARVRMHRAALCLPARMRVRAATAAVVFRRERKAAITLQALGRGVIAGRHVARLKRAARRRQTVGMIGGRAALAVAALIVVGLLLDGASSCRRRTLSAGDELVAPGECIEGASGSHFFGWIPGISTKAMLSVTMDGKMVARKPDGAEVVLAGHIPLGRRNEGLLCGAERVMRNIAGMDPPAYGARNVRGQLVLGREYHCSVFLTPAPKGAGELLDAWMERGIRVGFSQDGDLEVVSSKGTVWWSLANELAEEGGNEEASAVSEGPSSGSTDEGTMEENEEDREDK